VLHKPTARLRGVSGVANEVVVSPCCSLAVITRREGLGNPRTLVGGLGLHF